MPLFSRDETHPLGLDRAPERFENDLRARRAAGTQCRADKTCTSPRNPQSRSNYCTSHHNAAVRYALRLERATAPADHSSSPTYRS